jgi:hypothetical protein
MDVIFSEVGYQGNIIYHNGIGIYVPEAENPAKD